MEEIAVLGRWGAGRLDRVCFGLTALLAALAPDGAAALDFTPDNTPYLGDPTYLTPAHHLYGETTYGYHDISEDFVLPGGTISPHYTEQENTVFQELSYGINDRFLVSASIAYGAASETDTYSSGPQSFHAQGFFNPDLTATWRVIAQQPGRAPFNFDLQATYSPSLFQAKNSSSSASGTVASGEQSAELAIYVSRKLRSLTIQGFVEATYDSERRILETSDGSTTTYGTNFVYGGGFSSQLRFAGHLFVEVGSEALQQTPTRVSDPVENVANTRTFDPNIDSYIDVGWQVIPDRLVLSVEYDRDYFGDIAETGATGAIGTWKNQTENIYFLRARYLVF